MSGIMNDAAPGAAEGGSVMGIYIKGMEMPKEAGKYRIEFDQCGNPYLLSDNGDGGIWHIIPVPKHGDLIDRKELIKDDHQHYEYMSDEFYVTVRDIECAPTIIPAEEDECAV